MVEGEREVDEDFIQTALWSVVFFDDVVDVRHGGANEEGKEEGCEMKVDKWENARGVERSNVPTV